jgi:hypothetical protein
MAKSRPGRTKREEAHVRMTIPVPMLMRQAIRDRERLSGQSAASVVQNILLTALRVEMEMIRRDKSTLDSRRTGVQGSTLPLRKAE